MAGITLDKKLGVNPRLCFCPRCGGDSNSLAMLGNRNYKQQCNACDATVYGAGAYDKCVRCKASNWGDRIELTEFERVPGALCDDCEEQIEVVKQGGVFFKCELGCLGAIKSSEFTVELRKQHGIEAPAPLGVQFTREQCPNAENHK